MNPQGADDHLVAIRLAMRELQDQLQYLEEEVADLRAKFASHDHPFNPYTLRRLP